MSLIKSLTKNSKKISKTFIFPESNDERVLNAAEYILSKKLGKVTLISSDDRKLKLKPSKSLTIIDISFAGQFLDEYYTLRKKSDKNLTKENAIKDLNNPLTFSCMLLKNSFADGIIAGSVYSTTEVLRTAIRIIGLSKSNKTVSSFFLFTFPSGHKYADKVLAYADCGVIPFPDPEQLSDIAVSTSANFEKLTGKKAKCAFLSFSTKGSADHENLELIRKAVSLTKSKNRKLKVDGELQFDAAFIPEVAKRKDPDGILKGEANVFIFPDLNAGNIAYKITERIGGASATGPIVQGLAKPVMDLSRGCTAEDIVNMFVIASHLKKS